MARLYVWTGTLSINFLTTPYKYAKTLVCVLITHFGSCVWQGFREFVQFLYTVWCSALGGLSETVNLKINFVEDNYLTVETGML